MLKKPPFKARALTKLERVFPVLAVIAVVLVLAGPDLLELWRNW